MRPLNVHYDGTGWNADYVSTLTEDEFVGQFAAQYYGHVENLDERVKAAKAAYQFILAEYRKKHPQAIEVPVHNITDRKPDRKRNDDDE